MKDQREKIKKEKEEVKLHRREKLYMCTGINGVWKCRTVIHLLCKYCWEADRLVYRQKDRDRHREGKRHSGIEREG